MAADFGALLPAAVMAGVVAAGAKLTMAAVEGKADDPSKAVAGVGNEMLGELTKPVTGIVQNAVSKAAGLG